MIPAGWVRELLSNGGTPPAADEEHSELPVPDTDPELSEALPGSKE